MMMPANSLQINLKISAYLCNSIVRRIRTAHNMDDALCEAAELVLASEKDSRQDIEIVQIQIAEDFVVAFRDMNEGNHKFAAAAVEIGINAVIKILSELAKFTKLPKYIQIILGVCARLLHAIRDLRNGVTDLRTFAPFILSLAEEILRVEEVVQGRDVEIFQVNIAIELLTTCRYLTVERGEAADEAIDAINEVNDILINRKADPKSFPLLVKVITKLVRATLHYIYGPGDVEKMATIYLDAADEVIGLKSPLAIGNSQIYAAQIFVEKAKRSIDKSGGRGVITASKLKIIEQDFISLKPRLVNLYKYVTHYFFLKDADKTEINSILSHIRSNLI